MKSKSKAPRGRPVGGIRALVFNWQSHRHVEQPKHTLLAVFPQRSLSHDSVINKLKSLHEEAVNNSHMDFIRASDQPARKTLARITFDTKQDRDHLLTTYTEAERQGGVWRFQLLPTIPLEEQHKPLYVYAIKNMHFANERDALRHTKEAFSEKAWIGYMMDFIVKDNNADTKDITIISTKAFFSSSCKIILDGHRYQMKRAGRSKYYLYCKLCKLLNAHDTDDCSLYYWPPLDS
ncbi:hypothetical protein K492DRAFT_182052 [Lichtheimia hyalospora FSU 10163]|nr:hypothetical protein K492DRAFT_182052 [Lichtheimia hyalospora FSU 10163]